MSRRPLPMQPWRAGHISVPNGIGEVSSAWPVPGGLIRSLVSQSPSRCVRALCSISRVSDMTLSQRAGASPRRKVLPRKGEAQAPLRKIARRGVRVAAIPIPPHVAKPCYTLENLFPDWSFRKKTNRYEVHDEI